MTDLTYISAGNKKTECFSFDLPARRSCPGKTKGCSRDCYAASMMLVYPAVAVKYKRNRRFANSPKFVDYMIEHIPKDCQFRIHVSGDFFSVEYIQKWIQIVASRQDVTFYAYTRSWRIPDLLAQIILLHDRFANININLSVDDETGAPPSYMMEQMRWCYLTKTDNVPSWIRFDDIIFRSNHNGQKTRRKNDIKKGIDPDIRAPLIKRLGGQVCPLEQGRDISNFSCAKCRLCVDKPKVALHA